MSKQRFEAAWAAKLKELEGVTDALGKGIEPGIVETVAALQLLGLATNGSCEGHEDWGSPGPWVSVGAPERKGAFRWVGEAAITKKILAEMGATAKDIAPGKQHKKDVFQAFHQKFGEWHRKVRPKETAAYKEMCEESHRMGLRLTKLVRTFEGARVTEPLLVVNMMGGGTWFILDLMDAFTMQDGDAGYNRKLAKNLQAALAKRLKKRQAHMRAFTEFLKMEAKRAWQK